MPTVTALRQRQQDELRPRDVEEEVEEVRGDGC